MGFPKEFISKLRDIVKDVNYNEITSYTSEEELRNWIDSWSGAANRIINILVNSQNEADGWIPLTKLIPREEIPIQLLVVHDDDELFPISYVVCGFRYNDVWFSEGLVVHDNVVAWKPLDKEVDFKKIVELGWIE